MIRRPLLLLLALAGTTSLGTTPRLLADDDATATDEPAAETNDKAAAESKVTIPGVQFEATFADANGATHTRTNGSDEEVEGTLSGRYSSYGKVPPGQPRTLITRITEDETINGPDGQPGVLRLQYLQVPFEVAHSGFLLTGDEEFGKLSLPGWTAGEVTMTDLRRTFIEFKFRADNPHPNSFGTLMQFRIEPEIPDSYRHRADFGVVVAISRWRTFRRPISSADNVEQFLKTVNTKQPANFKLVWGQNGSIQNYLDGDSLLIDDVRIVIE